MLEEIAPYMSLIASVQRAITCRYTGKILDARRAYEVTLTDGDGQVIACLVMDGTAGDCLPSDEDMVATFRAGLVKAGRPDPGPLTVERIDGRTLDPKLWPVAFQVMR